jgi:hypothetical protein
LSRLGRIRPRSEPTLQGVTATTIGVPATLTTWAFHAGRKPPSAIFMIRTSGSLVEARGSFCFSACLRFVLSRRSRCASTSRSLVSAASTRSRRSRAARWRAGADALVAGRRIVVDLALELLDHGARLRQMLLQPGTAAVRGCPGAGANPHPVLRQLAEIDQAAGRQRRDILGQQPIEKLAVADPEVAQRVVVQRHPAGEPTVGIMAFAQPRQRPRAADPLAGRVEPQRQQQPGRDRRMPGPAFARLDRVLQGAEIELLDISPDQARRMVLADQAVDIHRAQFQLVALRLQKPRLAGGRSGAACGGNASNRQSSIIGHQPRSLQSMID